ncbi:membrane protein insertase YidC [bacterium]|nr:membrane protein insertase YidC [bacterium]
MGIFSFLTNEIMLPFLNFSYHTIYKRIQEEFKDKPEQMQKEILRIWKENKANPLSGCLPLLIQLPFFFAVYHTIASDTFNAILSLPGVNPGLLPFWITNLAKPDPWFILPVIIAGATYLSQKMMTMDPSQQMIMMMMPVVMGIISIKMPAGVLIYWAAQTIFSTAQQYWMMRETPEEVASSDVTVTVKAKRK